MNNNNTVEIGQKKHLSKEMRDRINNHCNSADNTIELAIKKMKIINEIKDPKGVWEDDILIFNYVSDYFKRVFPSLFKDKIVDQECKIVNLEVMKQQFEIIYEGIEIFLEGRERKELAPTIILKIKKKEEEIKQELKKQQEIRENEHKKKQEEANRMKKNIENTLNQEKPIQQGPLIKRIEKTADAIYSIFF